MAVLYVLAIFARCVLNNDVMHQFGARRCATVIYVASVLSIL